MNGVGMTIFQGGESIQLQTNDSDEDEDEIQDRKRLDEELDHQLQHAFGDLIDQSDTVDDSTHFTSNDLNYIKSVNRSDETHDYDVKKLKNIIDSKTREFKHIAELLENERANTERQITDMKKLVMRAEAEKDRANVTRQQTHELLVESKAKISDLEDHLEKSKHKMKLLDKTNSELVAELESTKTMLSIK